MRGVFLVLACSALIACEPRTTNDAAVAPMGVAEAGAQLGWTHTKAADEVVLSNREAVMAPAFRLACAKAGPTLTVSAGLAQVGMANMAPPFALVLSGATFPATLVPGADGAQNFSVSAPLTPDVLAAVRDSVTARIMVNDGYAFAESDVDPGQEFETFAAACAALTGVVAPQ